MKQKVYDIMNHGDSTLPEQVQQTADFRGQVHMCNAVNENKTLPAAASH